MKPLPPKLDPTRDPLKKMYISSADMWNLVTLLPKWLPEAPKDLPDAEKCDSDYFEIAEKKSKIPGFGVLLDPSKIPDREAIYNIRRFKKAHRIIYEMIFVGWEEIT